MKYALSITALLLAMSQQQPALAQGNGDNLVKQAVAAQGGADALRGLKGLAIKGDAQYSGQAGGDDRDMAARGELIDFLGARIHGEGAQHAEVEIAIVVDHAGWSLPIARWNE